MTVRPNNEILSPSKQLENAGFSPEDAALMLSCLNTVLELSKKNGVELELATMISRVLFKDNSVDDIPDANTKLGHDQRLIGQEMFG